MSDKKVNKLTYYGKTLFDLTEDTATEDDVMNGKTFHKASGESATGRAYSQGGIIATFSDTEEGITCSVPFYVLYERYPQVKAIYNEQLYYAYDIYSEDEETDYVVFSANGGEIFKVIKYNSSNEITYEEYVNTSAINEYVKSLSIKDNDITFTNVTDSKESTVTYSPDLSGKVDKVTNKATIVYGVDGYKKQTTYPINVDAVEWSVGYRNAKGQLNVASPTENTNAVNLEYLNNQIEAVELTGTLVIPGLTYSGTLTSEQYNKLINNKDLILTIQVQGQDYAKAFNNNRMYDISNNLITATCSFIDGENNETKYSLYIDGDSLTFKGGIIKTDLSDLTEEEWVFTLEDGSTITKKVTLWN